MIPLAIIRAQPGCEGSVALAREMGLDARGFPMFAVRARAWLAPDPTRFDALLAGSANVFRHGGEQLWQLRALPVFAVGEATADAARTAGFLVQASGQGGLQAMLDRLPAGMERLLRLCGAERVTLSVPPGVMIEERIVYASEPLSMPQGLRELLRHPCVVALHSGEAAKHFAARCDAEGIGREALALAAIGPRVAEAAGAGWADVQTAASPDDAALLALAARMCHTRAQQ